MESFFRTLKVELVYWQDYRTRDEARHVLCERGTIGRGVEREEARTVGALAAGVGAARRDRLPERPVARVLDLRGDPAGPHQLVVEAGQVAPRDAHVDLASVKVRTCRTDGTPVFGIEGDLTRTRWQFLNPTFATILIVPILTFLAIGFCQPTTHDGVEFFFEEFFLVNTVIVILIVRITIKVIIGIAIRISTTQTGGTTSIAVFIDSWMSGRGGGGGGR